jgi:hypothetical protein
MGKTVCMGKLLKISFLALAGFGGYLLWSRFGARLRGNAAPDARRVAERSELNVTEQAVGSDDPVAQAGAIIAESDERSDLSRDAPGIEHRQSEDTVEP